MNDIRPGTWASIKDLSTVYIMNQKVILCHYALRTWHHSYKGVGHCYGHSHGELPSYGKSFDVGVDCWDYTPMTSKQIVDKLESLPNIHAIPKEKEWDKTEK
jgi:calcineurin-like phosphoesterase family protein